MKSKIQAGHALLLCVEVSYLLEHTISFLHFLSVNKKFD